MPRVHARSIVTANVAPAGNSHWAPAPGTIEHNILTSLLFLKKKTDSEVKAEALGQKIDYPVFMAVAENVGFDRRGNTLYKRSPDGEDIIEVVEHRERIRTGGKSVLRVLRRKEKTVDDDLPRIAQAYQVFRQQNPVPGA